jgi:hypothetical protein
MSETRITTESSAFALEVTAVTAIARPADVVWAILIDTASHGRWNPFIVSFAGTIETGQRLDVQLQLPERKPQGMHPKVIEVEPGRSFTWLGHVGFPGVLDGRHRFEVRSTGPDSCEFVQFERLSGALFPAFGSMMKTKTPQAFVAMNDALRAEAERDR